MWRRNPATRDAKSHLIGPIGDDDTAIILTLYVVVVVVVVFSFPLFPHHLLLVASEKMENSFFNDLGFRRI